MNNCIICGEVIIRKKTFKTIMIDSKSLICTSCTNSLSLQIKTQIIYENCLFIYYEGNDFFSMLRELYINGDYIIISAIENDIFRLVLVDYGIKNRFIILFFDILEQEELSSDIFTTLFDLEGENFALCSVF